jgi:hypothetical protein
VSPQALGYDEPSPEERAEGEQAMARAAEAFERGKAVPPTLEDYRAAAAGEPATVIEALVARAVGEATREPPGQLVGPRPSEVADGTGP